MINVNIERAGEKQPEVITNQMRFFRITYSFYDSKNQYKEKMLQMIGLSLADCQGEIQKSVGGREVNILSHNSGRPINFISQSVLRILINKNLNWYTAEKSAADRQQKIDLIKAKKAVKIDRALDGLNQADENIKLEKMHGKTKHRI